MEVQSVKPGNPMLTIAAGAVILFCAAGIAAIMGWIPTSIGSGATTQTADASAKATAPAAGPQQQVPSPARAGLASGQLASNAACADCAVIESVRAVDVKGKGTGLGGVGGAVVGGLLGNQLGAGRGRDVMTVAGAVGGAVAGNEIEARAKSTRSYRITVRFDDGSSRVFSESSPPAWRAGDKVRIVHGQIRPNNA